MYVLTTHPDRAHRRERALPIPRTPEARWSGLLPRHENGDRLRTEPPEEEARIEEGPGEPLGHEPRARVLLAEGDEGVRCALARLLEGEGYELALADDAAALAGAIERERPDIVLVDLDLAGLDATEVLSAMQKRNGAGRLIGLTASSSNGGAARAGSLGAFEVLAKPLAAQQLLNAVNRAWQAQSALRRRIVGGTPVMEQLFASITRVAPLATTVLITGETGTGKELVARAIHDLSNRAGKPFVPVQCAALPETLLESELFGHVRGSFTGAVSTRQGLLEEANRGTLFLDEVSTLSPAIQVKLLRVLQERTVQRIGSNNPIQLDLRLLTASNIELAAEVHAGRFREDLYYRLQVFPIRVPPLRERKADIPLLIDHFRRRFAEANGIEAPVITAETALRMMEYDWPGNVRELENTVERMLVTHLGERTAPFERPAGEAQPALQLAERGRREGWDLARLEREYVLAMLEDQGGRRGETAERLGIDRRTLGRKLKAYRIALAGAGRISSPLARPPLELREASPAEEAWAPADDLHPTGGKACGQIAPGAEARGGAVEVGSGAAGALRMTEVVASQGAAPHVARAPRLAPGVLLLSPPAENPPGQDE